MNEEFGKILITNGTDKLFISVDKLTETNYPKDIWDAIGLVVIPSDHNVYNMNGKPGIMSLKHLRYNNQYDLQHDKIDLSKFRKYIVNLNGKLIKEKYSYLPFDKFCGLIADDEKTKYHRTVDLLFDKLSPSPYNLDYSKNLLYSSNEQNALGDFEGYKNCKQILMQTNNHPSFICYEYKTKGTKIGDWYLPTLGELGYVCNRQNEINRIFRKINNWKNNSALLLCDASMSSSLLDNFNSWAIDFRYGYIGYASLNDVCNIDVLPFLWNI